MTTPRWYRWSPAQTHLVRMLPATTGAVAALLYSWTFVGGVVALALAAVVVAGRYIARTMEVGGRRQLKLLEQAFREDRIPPGAAEEQWTTYLQNLLRQRSTAWSRVRAVHGGLMVAIILPILLRPPVVWTAVIAGACVLAGGWFAWREVSPRAPWVDQVEFLLLQLDANDGVRDP